MRENQYLTAQEAADELGISLETLYAYVSRGLIRSQAGDGKKRNRWYPLEDVQRLKKRKGELHHPDKVASGAMQAGTPVMESAITMITDDCFYYRGYNALTLATTHSIEQVASLIWTGDFSKEHSLFLRVLPERMLARYQKIRSHLNGLTPLEAFQICLPLVAFDDIAAYDLRPEAVAQTGARILQLLTTVTVDQQYTMQGQSIAQTLQQGWVPHDEQAAALLTAALILCADQELNVTSFTARCVASAGSTPYAVISSGLSALQGIKHAGQTERIEAFLRETDSSANVRSSMISLLKRGEAIPGFGEVVPGFGSVFYPTGDPRGKLLLELTAQTYPQASTVLLAQHITEETYNLLGERPTIFLALSPWPTR